MIHSMDHVLDVEFGCGPRRRKVCAAGPESCVLARVGFRGY
jgi:hypothetical protein